MGKGKKSNKPRGEYKKKEKVLEKDKAKPPPNSPELIQEEQASPIVVAESENQVQSVPESTEELVTVEKVEQPVESAAVDEKAEEIAVEEENKVEHVESNQEVTDDEEQDVGIDGGDKVEEKVESEDEEDNEDEDKEEGEKDSIDGGISQRAGTDDQRSIAVSEPEEWTTYEWERKDEDYNVVQAIFVKSYNKKFAAALQLFNPEFRYASDIGPCETFDSEGVRKLIEKMKEEIGVRKILPFDGDVTVSEKELRRFLSEILHTIKFCLRLACAQRGYEFKSGKLNVEPISAVWGDGIDPITELKTMKAILDEMKEPLMKNAAEGQEARFWAETDIYFGTVLPALESFDSKLLSENSITDCMNSIHGRIELGFEITEDEVDKMLERSFSEDGFGEFPPTALYAPQVFKTTNQLKMIFGQLEKMSKVIDIRVKLSGVQMITRIFEIISDEDAMLVMEEFKDKHPVTIEKMFGLDPKKFEINTNDPKRSQYLKIFFTMLAEVPREDFFFLYKRLVAVLKCLYLVFDPFDVNMILFKIIGTRIRESYDFESDRKLLFKVLMQLPEPLRKRLEIGPEFSTGEVSDDRESMYYQLRNVISSGVKENVEKFYSFIAFSDRHNPMICIEKGMRIPMKCVETGSHQMMAVEVLRLLNRPSFPKHKLSNEFFEDLLVLALSKYSVPDAKTSEKKYAFIDMVLSILDRYHEEGHIELNAPKVSEIWTNMGHPWFSVLYLSHRFPVTKPSIPAPQFPWLSADVWTDEKKGEADFKNYVPLAKVLTAWPNCTDLKTIADLVSEHVPIGILRADLYTAMKKYISEFTMEEVWKQKLLRAFENKIIFLTSHSKKDENEAADKQEILETPELELNKNENINSVSQSAPVETVTNEEKDVVVEEKQDKESTEDSKMPENKSEKEETETEKTEEVSCLDSKSCNNEPAELEHSNEDAKAKEDGMKDAEAKDDGMKVPTKEDDKKTPTQKKEKRDRSKDVSGRWFYRQRKSKSYSNKH